MVALLSLLDPNFFAERKQYQKSVRWDKLRKKIKELERDSWSAKVTFIGSSRQLPYSKLLPSQLYKGDNPIPPFRCRKNAEGPFDCDKHLDIGDLCPSRLSFSGTKSESCLIFNEDTSNKDQIFHTSKPRNAENDRGRKHAHFHWNHTDKSLAFYCYTEPVPKFFWSQLLVIAGEKRIFRSWICLQISISHEQKSSSSW